MISNDKAKKVLDGRSINWFLGYSGDKWRSVVPVIKLKLLRQFWEVSLWDRICGRDVPKCDRCKAIISEFPRFILLWPLCDDCYEDYRADKLIDGISKHGEDKEYIDEN